MGLVRLLTFVLVIYVVWRLGKALIGPVMTSEAPNVTPKEASANPKVQDMFECHICKTYVTASSPRCDRFDCPRS